MVVNAKSAGVQNPEIEMLLQTKLPHGKCGLKNNPITFQTNTARIVHKKVMQVYKMRCREPTV